MAARIPPHVQVLLRSLNFDRPATIVDVGANPVNEAPYTALLKAGGCRVVGFEPQDDAFAALQVAKTPNETYFPHAVGDGAPARLRIFAISGLTSTLAPHDAGLALVGGPKWRRVVDEVEMETVTLDGLADLPPFDLLKIDIQGGENAVFRHAERVMAEATAVIVELRYLRLYEDEPMMGGVDCELRRQGFELHRFLFNKTVVLPSSMASRLRPRRAADQLLDGDAVYIRDLTGIAGWTAGQVARLALLAAAVFDSHSLVLHLLDDLVRRKVAKPGLPEAYLNAMPPELVQG